MEGKVTGDYLGRRIIQADINPPMVMKTTRIPTQSDDDEATCSGGVAVTAGWIVMEGNPATARVTIGVPVAMDVGDEIGVEVAGGGWVAPF